MKEIKRSMAVYPSPIVIQDDGSARHPTAREHEARRLKGEWMGERGYTITRVTNSVEYDPGEALTKTHVEALINENWTVTVLIGEGT